MFNNKFCTYAIACALECSESAMKENVKISRHSIYVMLVEYNSITATLYFIEDDNPH